MVTEKVVIILIVIAIVLSLISVTLTLAQMNLKQAPKAQVIHEIETGNKNTQGQMGLYVAPNPLAGPQK
jgi:hypothetical protein